VAARHRFRLQRLADRSGTVGDRPLLANDKSSQLASELPAGLRVAITHDFMEIYGGAERVTQEMAMAFPDAPVTAILARPEVAERMGVGERVRSLLPSRPGIYRHYRLLTAAFPALTDRTRLPDADVVLSSSYAFAHRLRAANDAPRVCYCHSPLRFAWTMTSGYREVWAPGGPTGLAFELFAGAMRRSDRRSAQPIAGYLTQSPFTRRQIRRFYGREAEVVGAPVDCELFHPTQRGPGDYFLLCGRIIEPYKKVAMAMEAFRALGEHLIVAGEGPALPELRAAAPQNVEFVGHLEDRELVDLMQGCKAAIFPSRDDFGLTPVEVMACGRPVLAYAGGGARYTVIPGLSGELFSEQTPEAVVDAVRAFHPTGFDPAAIREHALQWDRKAFRNRLVSSVARLVLGEAAPSRPPAHAAAVPAVA
jgi:glycosyltransferase involved in cell wall biosynthesis